MTQVTGNVTATTLTYATTIVNIAVNGDFETGVLYPWETLYATTSVATTYKSDLNGGTYGCYFSCNAGDVGGIRQSFSTTVTEMHSISLDYISDIGVIIGLGGFDLFTLDATDTWTNFSTDGPFLYEEEPLTDINFCHLYTGRGNYAEVDNVSFTGVITTGNVSSATIEDSSKTWTADQFNTDGMFILTSGDVKGYSCTILDTFENYIQVPTTFANIINNIRVYETGYGNYEDFETGATTWTKDDELNIDFESTGPGGETPSPHSGTYCCKISQVPE
jgi:hypothetical protein